MKSGSQTHPGSRLGVVARMDQLRRQSADDPAAKAELSKLVSEGRLKPYWERVDHTNVVTLPKRRHGAGTRHQQLEAQITRATSPEERSQFEVRRGQLEHEEEHKPKKKVAA